MVSIQAHQKRIEKISAGGLYPLYIRNTEKKSSHKFRGEAYKDV